MENMPRIAKSHAIKEIMLNFGSTVEEAREMAADAIRAYCASLLKHGETIPIESPEEQFIGRLSIDLETA